MRDLNDLCYFVQVVPRVQDRLETHAPGLTASLATKATETSNLLALCVARAVGGVSSDETDDRTRLLADAIALNVGA